MNEQFVRDPELLIQIIGASTLLVGGSLLFLTSTAQRLMVAAFSVLYILYNGIGASFVNGVHSLYVFEYFVGHISLIISFIVFSRAFSLVGNVARGSMSDIIHRVIVNDSLVVGLIIIFFLVSLAPLIYPEFHLSRLIRPPNPDVAAQFFERQRAAVTGKFDTLSKVISNAELLLFPFYWISLLRFRKSPLTLLILTILPLYFFYCDRSYISRGKVLEYMFIYGGIVWYFNPAIRKYLVIAGIVALPVVPIVLLQYMTIRSGGTASAVSSIEAATTLLIQEASFPTVSEKVYNSGKQLNLPNYLLWLTTLPIPKVVIGSVPTSSAQMEISAIILDIRPGQDGYFASLGGLVIESHYTYGSTFFWIHFCTIGMFMAFAAKFSEQNPYLIPILFMYIVLMAYNVNRAGVSSALPVFINRFLSLYVLLLVSGIYRLFVMTTTQTKLLLQR